MNAAEHPVIDTPDGRISGRQLGDVTRFLGIPYAAPPVGALRLRSPRPVAAWAGQRDGGSAAPASLQTLGGNQVWMNEPIARQDEDCLVLNVWTPDVAGRAPVLLWLHGGQTRNGHGAAPGIDGAALAARGLVVVTINYRLGALGGLAHPALQDESTGFCANWGLQDKLAALAWVQRCIKAYGGDPARVTLAGQSSGAANAALIAQHRLGQGQYARVIAQSPPLFRPPMFVGLAAAAEYTEALASALGVDVPGLRQVDGPLLQRAEHTLAYSPELTARMGRPRTAPVLDGQLLRHWPWDGPAAGVPVLAGWTRDEADFWFHLRDGQGCSIAPQKAPQDAAELAKRCAGLMKLHYAFDDAPPVAGVLAAYADAGDVGRQWSAMYTDLAFRGPILQWLGRNARAGLPTWGYEFAHPMCSADGGSPHATDVPLVFGTWAHPHFAGKIGDGEAAAATTSDMGRAWAAFVRDGDPGPAWPRLDPLHPQVMQFGQGAAAMQPLARAQALECWPAYRC
jgi:para-nitrobenzyl esterase